MDTLEIPIIDIPDRGFSLDVVVSANSLKPKEIEPLPLEKIRVAGTITPLIDQFLFRGTVSGTFENPCDRCLEHSEFPVSVEVTWTFEEGPEKDYLQQLMEETSADDEEEALGFYTFDGKSIKLMRPVWDEITLAAPSKFVCSDTCDGLCPGCGVNRNTTPCDCDDDPIETPTTNSGFAGLKDMFPDLPES